MIALLSNSYYDVLDDNGDGTVVIVVGMMMMVFAVDDRELRGGWMGVQCNNCSSGDNHEFDSTPLSRQFVSSDAG